MNKLNVFKTIAASALVLSTIASPAAFAAPAKEKQAMKTSIISTVALDSKDQASMLINAWSDPLSLAKQYAPDTVKEWEQVLAQYNEHYGQLEGVSLALNEEVSNADDVLSITIDSIGVKPAPVTEATILEHPMEINFDNNTNVEGVTVALKAIPSKLINAQVELEEAVQAKADKQIKTALANLLTTYKEELNK